MAGPDAAGRRELPDLGAAVERSLIRPSLHQRGRGARERSPQVIDKPVAAAINEAAEEVASGQWDDEFPIDVYQTGSGTSSNMNMNEVLATLASERLGARCIRTTRSTPRSRPTTCSRRPSTWPPPPRSQDAAGSGPGPSGQGAAPEEPGNSTSGQVRPDPPDGRHAGDPRPGVRRAMPRPSRYGIERLRPRCPGSASCRSGAPPSAPASTLRGLRRAAYQAAGR